MRWPLQPLQPFQQTQLQRPFGQSVDSLCHLWFTTTNVSYRFPILKLPPPPCAVLLVYQTISAEKFPCLFQTVWLRFDSSIMINWWSTIIHQHCCPMFTHTFVGYSLLQATISWFSWLNWPHPWSFAGISTHKTSGLYFDLLSCGKGGGIATQLWEYEPDWICYAWNSISSKKGNHSGSQAPNIWVCVYWL